jgi:phage protein D
MGFLAGSPAGLEPVIEGYVTQVDLHLGAAPTDVWLDVEGMDASVLLSLEEKARLWPNMADSDIAEQVVSPYGFRVQATSTTPVRQETETLVLQRSSDAQFVRQLAARNGYLFYFTKQPGDNRARCIFGPPALDGEPQSELAVQFGEGSNLVSFDVSVSGVRPLAVTARQLDARTKETASGVAQSSQLRRLGKSSTGDLVTGKLAGLVTPQNSQAGMLLLAQPSADPTELTGVAQAVRDEAEWLITATGEINVDAYGSVLRAGRLVLVKGAGAEYSGAYFVTKVRHIVKSDGTYEQRFVARRNARGVDGSERFGSNTAAMALASI